MFSPDDDDVGPEVPTTTLTQNAVYAGTISDDEEIDVINGGPMLMPVMDGALMMTEDGQMLHEDAHFQHDDVEHQYQPHGVDEQFQEDHEGVHYEPVVPAEDGRYPPDTVFLMNDVDDGMFDEMHDEMMDDDVMNFPEFVGEFEEFEDPQQYEVGILENPQLYSAHYMNMEDDFDSGTHIVDVFYEALQSDVAVEIVAPAERLQRYPEMEFVMPLRRAKSSAFTKSLHTLLEPTQSSRMIDPKSSAAAELLVTNKVYQATEMTEQEEIEAAAQTASQEQPNMPFTQPILNPETNPKQIQPVVARRQQPNLQCAEEPKQVTAQAVISLTPLPDRFFQRRLSISAEQAGFVSECLSCPTCQFMFRHRALLETHIEKHKKTGLDDVMTARAGLACPMKHCTARGDCIATIIKHLRTVHSTNDITFERIVFKDLDEFKLWKSELERLTMSKFTRSSGKQNTFSRSTYYQCHHSGKAGKETFRVNGRLRSRQSKKLGRTCTAFFHVRENDDGTVLFRGCTKHSGHGVDVRQLPLSEDIRMEIAQLLIEGLDENTIVERLHESADRSDRRFYIQGYEVRNVAKKIEKFKSEYQIKIDNGEAVPDLLAILGKKPESRHIGRAKLACRRFPVTDDEPAEPEFIDLTVEDEEEEVEGYYEEMIPDPSYEIVVEDGLFNVPVGPMQVFTEQSMVSRDYHHIDAEAIHKYFQMHPKPPQLTEEEEAQLQAEEDEQVQRNLDAIKNSMMVQSQKRKLEQDDLDEDFSAEEDDNESIMSETAAPTRFSTRLYHKYKKQQREQQRQRELEEIDDMPMHHGESSSMGHIHQDLQDLDGQQRLPYYEDDILCSDDDDLI